MKKAYVRPEINASMNGTLEGVYACDPREMSNKGQNDDPNCGCGGYWFYYHSETRIG